MPALHQEQHREIATTARSILKLVEQGASVDVLHGTTAPCVTSQRTVSSTGTVSMWTARIGKGQGYQCVQAAEEAEEDDDEEEASEGYYPVKRLKVVDCLRGTELPPLC